MKAKNDRIIVRKGRLPEKSKGGIILADTARHDAKVKFNVGKVIDFGPGMMTVSGERVSGYDGKAGDIIVWEQFGEFDASVIGEGLWVLRAEDVTASLTDEEASKWDFDEPKPPEEEKEEPEHVFEKDKANIQCENKDCQAAFRPREIEVDSRFGPFPPCEYCGKETHRVIEGAPVMQANNTPLFHSR